MTKKSSLIPHYYLLFHTWGVDTYNYSFNFYTFKKYTFRSVIFKLSHKWFFGPSKGFCGFFSLLDLHFQKLRFWKCSCKCPCPCTRLSLYMNQKGLEGEIFTKWCTCHSAPFLSFEIFCMCPISPSWPSEKALNKIRACCHIFFLQ